MHYETRLSSEEHAAFEHQPYLFAAVEVTSQPQAGFAIRDAHVRSLGVGEEYSLLVGGRKGPIIAGTGGATHRTTDEPRPKPRCFKANTSKNRRTGTFQFAVGSQGSSDMQDQQQQIDAKRDAQC